MHILVRSHPADGRLVHADIFRNLFEHQGLEALHAFFKKLLLKCDDTRDDFKNGLVPLLDAADNPLRPAQLLIQIRLGPIRVVLLRADDHLPVIGVDAQAGKAVVVQENGPFTFMLDHEDIRYDKVIVRRTIGTTGFGLKHLDHTRGIEHRLDRGA